MPLEKEQTLPQAMERFLVAYQKQRNRLLMLRLLCILGILLVGWVTLACLVDRVAHLSQGAREVFLASTLVAVVLWIVAILRWTLLAAPDVLRAARQLEYLRPDLDERLVTVCSRLRDGAADQASGQLLAALAADVDLYTQQHGVPRMVSWQWLSRHAIALCTMLLFTGALTVVPVVGFTQLFQRVATPWRAIEPVTTTRLTLLQEFGRTVGVMEGSVLAIDVLAYRPGPEGVLLRTSTDGTTWDSRPMLVVGDGRFECLLGPVTADRQFMIASGDASTPVVLVRVLRAPAITDLNVHYVYPEYLARPPRDAKCADGLIEAPVGTTAVITAVASERLESARMTGPGSDLPLSKTPEPNVMQATLSIRRDQPYEIQLMSADHVQGVFQGGVICATPDLPPTVHLGSPENDLRLRPRAVMPVTCEASDDNGIATLALKMQVNSSPAVEIPIPQSTGPKQVSGSMDVDLGRYSLKIGDVVTLCAIARDAAGQEAASPPRLVYIASQSITANDYERLAAMKEALAAAKGLATSLEAAGRSRDQYEAEQNDEFRREKKQMEYRQRLGDSAQQAENVKQAIWRAVAHSEDRKLNDSLASAADQTQLAAIDVPRLAAEGAANARAKPRIEQLAQSAHATEQKLQAAIAMQEAAVAMADMKNVEAAEQSTNPAARQAAQRLRQDVADEMKAQGLNPADPAVEQQLQKRIDSGKDSLQNTKAPDYVASAREWAKSDDAARATLSARLKAAADIEAVRLDGSPRRAKDLDLAAKAADAVDARPKSADPAERDQFADAFGSLEKAHAARRAVGKDASSEHSVSEQRARETLQSLLEKQNAAAGANADADEGSRERALDANAKMEEGDLAAAAKREAEMNLDAAAASRAAEALAELEAMQQLAARQEELQHQLQNGASAATAASQKQLADEIAREEEQAGEGQPESVRTALAAIAEARQRLKELPPRVDEFAQASEKQFNAHDATAKAQAAAAASPPDRSDVAQKAAAAAKATEHDAAQVRLDAQARVPKSEMQRIAAELSEFAPETTPAVTILKKTLTPAIDDSERHADANDASSFRADVHRTKDATVAAMKALDDAQRAVLERSAAAAARQYARLAADALQQSPADPAAALQAQAQAANALSQQRGHALQEASQANLRTSEHFRPVLVARGTVPPGQKAFSDAREWGRLEQREKGQENAPVHDEDPTGYRRMLEVYFRALGNAGGRGEKK